MKKYVLIVMLSIMSAGHAMNFDINSEESFPSLKKTGTASRQKNRRKQNRKEIKKDETLDEGSDSNVDNVNNASKPIPPDYSMMSNLQLPEEMKKITIYLPSQLDFLIGLDFHFCSHFGRALCDKLYDDYDESHGKYLSQVLSDIDEIIKKYADYMRSAQAPESQTILRLSTAQRLIIKSVFSNHKEVSDFLQAMLHDNKNKNFNSNEIYADNEDIDYQARTYTKYYPIDTHPKIFDGSLLEAGIQFDVPW